MDEYDGFWGSFVGVVLIVIVIAFTVSAVGLGIYKTFTVPYENARRDASVRGQTSM